MRVRLILKWVLIVIGGVVGLGLIGGAILYAIIGNDLSRTFDVEGTSVVVLDDDSTRAEGERLARVRGCMGGCHGETVNGAVFFEVPDGTRVLAPDLALAAQLYSVEELERIIRHGVRPDRTSVILAMPSNMFYHLSDQDLGAIIAYLKSQAPVHPQLPDTRVGPLGRVFFFFFKQSFGTILAAEIIDHSAPRLDSSDNDALVYGNYLATTICSECHGDDLRGAVDGFAPSLAVVAAYSLEDFRNLMRTGEPIGDRELDLMASVAMSRFSYLTDIEIDSLHTYLQTLAATVDEH